MSIKKFAVRGLIILAVAVTVCMFFSETIVTISTAKVKIMTPRQGKLTQNVALTGTLSYPVSKQVYIPDADGMTLNVLSVKVAAGYEVEAGDVIFTAEIANYDATLKTLKTEYASVEAQLDALERKDIKLKKTDTAWAEAYDRVLDAKELNLTTRLAVIALLRVEGLTMGANDALPEDASDALKAAFAAYEQAASALTEAKRLMSDAERFSIDDATREYIIDRRELTDKLALAEENLLQLTVNNQRLSAICAQEDGYITEINVKAGDAFSPAAAAYSICPKDETPVLRASTKDAAITITKGTTVIMAGKKGDVEGEITAIGTTLDGDPYAEVKLSKSLLRDLGTVYSLSRGDVAMTVQYRAKQATTLLPSSAVRGSGDDRYVYTADREYSNFGVTRMKLSKLTVKVLAEADGNVSVEEDLSYRQIAYMEDRAVSEGTYVMEYVE